VAFVLERRQPDLSDRSADRNGGLWTLPAGQPLGSPLRHPDRVNGVASPDGRMVATACSDHSPDLASAANHAVRVRCCTQRSLALAVSADGGTLLTAWPR